MQIQTLLDKLKETPLFEDEIPSRYLADAVRVYAHLFADREVLKYAFRMGTFTFKIYFVEGQELQVLGRIMHRHPEYFRQPSRRLLRELRRLFGHKCLKLKSTGYWLVLSDSMQFPVKSLGFFIATEVCVKMLDKWDDKKFVENICREIVAGIVTGVKRVVNGQAYAVSLPSTNAARMMYRSLKEGLPDRYSVVRAGRKVIIYNGGD